MDAALMETCSDRALAPAIVEQFITAAGSNDPLAVTVIAAGRLVLIPKRKSADEALATVKGYAGRAVVRVGLTQFPAGSGVSAVTNLPADIFDPCENLRTGTALFAKVARIVTKWYGRPTNHELLPQMMDDALYAWRTGSFEGMNVFRAEDPGGPTFFTGEEAPPQALPAADSIPAKQQQSTEDASEAGMRVDLSRIQGVGR